MPFGEVWRTGANEATTFVTSSDVVVGGKTVPAGSYTIFTVPTADKWTLIVNKKTGEWGIPYKYESDELARVDMKVSTLPSPVENFTIAYGSLRSRLHTAPGLGDDARLGRHLGEIAITSRSVRRLSAGNMGRRRYKFTRAGFQRRRASCAAAVSSSRETRVECGASSTICGSSSTSSAIDFMASMNKSISSIDSLSVGSIISAPGTISGNAVV